MPQALAGSCCCSPPPSRAPRVVVRTISFSAPSLSSPLLYHAITASSSSSSSSSFFVNLGCGGGRGGSGFNPFLRMERFLTRGTIDKNKGLVKHLQQYGIIKSKEVAEVLETIDRGLFVPDGTAAYVDSPLPIGYNATISAPHMHATCLELLKDHLQPGMHALDVGSGLLLARVIHFLMSFGFFKLGMLRQT